MDIERGHLLRLERSVHTQVVVGATGSRGRICWAWLHVTVLLRDGLGINATCLTADANHAAETYPSATVASALKESQVEDELTAPIVKNLSKVYSYIASIATSLHLKIETFVYRFTQNLYEYFMK